MGVTSGIVMLAITWFMVLFVVLPIGLRTQGDVGEKVPGTHDGAPANFKMKRTAIIVSLIALVVWGGEVFLVNSGWITIRDLDIGHFMGPAPLE